MARKPTKTGIHCVVVKLNAEEYNELVKFSKEDERLPAAHLKMMLKNKIKYSPSKMERHDSNAQEYT